MSRTAHPPAVAHPVAVRYPAVDMLRGVAMVWMTVFHFCFDLQHAGYLRANFYADPFWTMQRMAIVSLFVFCAGFGQAIALQQGHGWKSFWKRWRQIAGCALAVSVGSWWMFPNSYIYFGILHGIALMLMGVRLLAGAGRFLWLLGCIAVALPWIAANMHGAWPALDFLNSRSFNWLGLISRKPITEDYAPLFPWLGVMCFGLASGQWVLRCHATGLARLGDSLAHGVLGRPARGLATMGRWSLAYYMMHQPVLLAALALYGIAK